MTKFKKALLAITLAIIIAFGMPVSVLASQSTKSIFTSSTYTHQDKFDERKIINGIDLSEHNGTVDFSKVKKAGVDFVILRLGWIGNKSNHTLDKKFEEYYEECKSLGIPIGVYVYSYCESVDTVKSGAKWVIEKLKGKTLDYPVYIDMEDSQIEDLSKTTLTNITTTFFDTLEDAGYDNLGVYANKYWLTEKLDASKFDDYSVWLAHYTTKTTYSGNYDIWQYSESGSVDGISGNVDCNFMYADPNANHLVISDISNKAYTGSEIKPKVTVTYNGETLKKSTDYTVTYTNNTDIGTAKVTVKGINDYEGLSTTKSFKIVPAKVTELNMTARATNLISFDWQKVANADGYEIQVYQNYQWKTAGTSTYAKYTVKSLNSATDYKFRVRAYKTVDSKKYYGSYSDVSIYTTTPDKVTGISVATRSTNYLKLTWKNQSGASYNVYKYNYSTEKYELYKQTTTNTVKISNLKPATKYKFRVMAVKEDTNGKLIKGEKSDAFVTVTKPSAPTIKSAKSSATKKIKVSWAKTTASGYQVKWSTTKDFSSNYKSTNVKSSLASTTIKTAQSGKTYYVKVRAYKTVDGKKIYSSWSKPLSVKTK